MRIVLATLLTATLAPTALAQSPKDILEGGFSGAVRRGLQTKLAALGRTEWSESWGHTAETWAGKTKVEFQGIKSKVVKIMERVNDGEWKKAWVEPQARSFDINFSNFRKSSGKPEVTFHFDASCQMRGQAEYRKYKAGAQLLSVTGKGRATLHVHVDMRVYLFEKGTKVGWETTGVDLKITDVVAEKVGAVGGEAARVLGNAFKAAADKWLPEQQREATAGAKRAIGDALKDNQEIRSDIAKLIRTIK